MPHSFKSSSIFGEPQIWAGSRTWVFPTDVSRAASERCTLRLVASEFPYSALRFAKPNAPSGSPMLPDTV